MSTKSLLRGCLASSFLVSSLFIGATVVAEEGQREKTFETTLHANFYDTTKIGFGHGSSVEVKSTTGWGFFWGYNFNNHFNAGVDMSWAEPNMKTTIGPGVGNLNARDINGDFHSFSLMALGTANLLSGPFTPYLTGGVGWTAINTNIPTGLPQPGCWYDPWWGYACNYYYPTYNADKISYLGGGGLRWDILDHFFMRASWNRQWVDMRGGHKPAFDSVRAEIGIKF